MPGQLPQQPPRDGDRDAHGAGLDVPRVVWSPPRDQRARAVGRVHFEVVETSLRDGTPVLIRPVRPEDGELVRRGFERLSEQSRLQRFMTPLRELSEGQLRYFTELDFVDHLAWGAVLADHPEEGIGIARCVRVPEEPSVAEAAVTVIDEYQGRGLGTLLLAILAFAAREAGISTFRAYVMEANAPMRELLDELGATTRHDSSGALVVDMPLEVDDLPDTAAARLIRAIAVGLGSPGLAGH